MILTPDCPGARLRKEPRAQERGLGWEDFGSYEHMGGKLEVVEVDNEVNSGEGSHSVVSD